MKSLIITVLAIIFGLMFFFYRRRLKLAIMVAGGMYIGLTAVRFIFMREESDRFSELGLALGCLAALWLVTNLVTRLIARRRRGRARR